MLKDPIYKLLLFFVRLFSVAKRSSCYAGKTKGVPVSGLLKRKLPTDIFFHQKDSCKGISLSGVLWTIELWVTSSSPMFASAENHRQGGIMVCIAKKLDIFVSCHVVQSGNFEYVFILF